MFNLTNNFIVLRAVYENTFIISKIYTYNFSNPIPGRSGHLLCDTDSGKVEESDREDGREEGSHQERIVSKLVLKINRY